MWKLENKKKQNDGPNTAGKSHINTFNLAEIPGLLIPDDWSKNVDYRVTDYSSRPFHKKNLLQQTALFKIYPFHWFKHQNYPTRNFALYFKTRPAFLTSWLLLYYIGKYN